MEVGYLPDMFGHVAQMPQLLRGAGFADAVVWRGVPSAVDKTAFWWASPDGSAVRAEYLLGGYSTGASVGDDAKAFVRRLEAFEEENSGFLLGPDGADPVPERRGPPRAPAVAGPGRGGGQRDPGPFRDRDLLAARGARRGSPRPGLPSWHGELRSGARANVLMGVASNRVDVKQAAARAERALEQLAEPLAALLMAPEPVPGGGAADRLARARAELGSRLDLRLLARRGRRRRAPPLRRGDANRRGGHRARSRPARLVVVGSPATSP